MYLLNPPCYYSFGGSGFLVELRVAHVCKLRAAGVESAEVEAYDALFAAAHKNMVAKQMPEHERATLCEQLASVANWMIAQRQQPPPAPPLPQPLQPIPMYRVSK